VAMFQYQAYDGRGAPRHGRVEAETLEAAYRALRGQNLFPVQVKLARPSILSAQLSLGEPKVRRDEVVATFRQLATMIDAEIPIATALQVLAETGTGPLRKALNGVLAHVRGGNRFADGLSLCPKIFPAVVVSMLRSGELTGSLKQSLEQSASFLERQRSTLEKVKSALTYPALVSVFAMSVTVFLLTKVIPSITDTFVRMGVPLPWPTRAVMTLSHFLLAWGWVGLLVVAGLVGGLVWYGRTDRGRLAISRVQLRLPIVGPLLHKAVIARLTRTLSSLLSSSVPLLQALEVTAAVVGNPAVAQGLMAARESLRAGRSIAEPMRADPIFPPMIVQMIAIGEQSKTLDTMLAKSAQLYENDVETLVNRLQPLIEPILMGGIGIAVGVLVLASVLPSFSLATQMQP